MNLISIRQRWSRELADCIFRQQELDTHRSKKDQDLMLELKTRERVLIQVIRETRQTAQAMADTHEYLTDCFLRLDKYIEKANGEEHAKMLENVRNLMLCAQRKLNQEDT